MKESAGNQRFSLYKQNSGLQPDSDNSASSTYSSSQYNYLQNRRPFREKSQGFLGVFVSCFRTSNGKPQKETDQESGTTQTNDVSSFSASTGSTISSKSHNKIFRSTASYRSYSLNDTRQETREFSVEEIYRATRNYSTENIIGQGGFGTVYKGNLKDGSLIAVKRAKKNLYQHLSSDFKSEIQTMSKIEHLNLVRFLGFLEHDHEQIIVTEYVGNGTRIKNAPNTGALNQTLLGATK